MTQEGAKLESERTRVTEAQEHEPTSKQLANAMRIKMSSIDKVICNRRESQERIIKSYRGLVVSVASSYQGKGLSLQDLIQVSTPASTPTLFSKLFYEIDHYCFSRKGALDFFEGQRSLILRED